MEKEEGRQTPPPPPLKAAEEPWVWLVQRVSAMARGWDKYLGGAGCHSRWAHGLGQMYTVVRALWERLCVPVVGAAQSRDLKVQDTRKGHRTLLGCWGLQESLQSLAGLSGVAAAGAGVQAHTSYGSGLPSHLRVEHEPGATRILAPYMLLGQIWPSPGSPVITPPFPWWLCPGWWPWPGCWPPSLPSGLGYFPPLLPLPSTSLLSGPASHSFCLQTIQSPRHRYSHSLLCLFFCSLVLCSALQPHGHTLFIL